MNTTEAQTKPLIGQSRSNVGLYVNIDKGEKHGSTKSFYWNI